MNRYDVERLRDGIKALYNIPANDYIEQEEKLMRQLEFENISEDQFEVELERIYKEEEKAMNLKCYAVTSTYGSKDTQWHYVGDSYVEAVNVYNKFVKYIIKGEVLELRVADTAEDLEVNYNDEASSTFGCIKMA